MLELCHYCQHFFSDNKSPYHVSGLCSLMKRFKQWLCRTQNCDPAVVRDSGQTPCTAIADARKGVDVMGGSLLVNPEVILQTA